MTGCAFRTDSACALRHRDEVLVALEAAGGGAGGASPSPWHGLRDAHYVTHDCPLPSEFNASVSKPLHLKSAGEWAAVLLLSDEGPADDPGGDPPTEGGGARRSGRSADPPAVVGCAAIVFDVRFTPQPPTTAPPADADGERGRGFEQISHGMSCRDGSDLLEGPLDDYTDCDEASRLCALTKKCRARCARRVSCAYYTTYASGFCQLSSRCEEEMRAADASARTFRKRPAAVPAS
mmetsp:Transcript_61115/g.182023  ORF Transcript_61115/g.182023 Transcript_61115/m.182023 type:complete len:236 (+) Transcript_61115:10-717(+)